MLLSSATVAATWLTVTDAVALAEPLVAIIVALPLATAVTVPFAAGHAIVASLDVHDTVAPGMMSPFWSLTVAVSGAVSPIDERLTDALDRVIEVATRTTGWVGVVSAGGSHALKPVPSITIRTRLWAFMSDLRRRVNCQ